MQKTHTYDIIIPIYHPDKSFDRVLEMLKKQEPAPNKIILLETLGDGDEFVPYRGCEVVVVRDFDFDHASTRRLGVSYSSAEAFIMMTQDAMPADTKLCAKLMEGLYAWENEKKPGEKAGVRRLTPEEEREAIIRAYRQSSSTITFGSGPSPDDVNRLHNSRQTRIRRKRIKAQPPINSTIDMDPDTSSWDNVAKDDYVDAIQANEKAIKKVKILPDGRIAMCYARQVAKPGCGEIERFSRSYNYPDKSRTKGIADVHVLGIKAYFASDVCCAYNRDLYESVMGFEPHVIFNEDMLYAAKAIRQGYRIAYRADACVEHSHNYSAMEQYHRNFDNGMSQAMYPEVFGGVTVTGEGVRLVKETAAHLLKKGKFWLLPKLFWQSGMKYLGFKAGKNFRRYSYKALRKKAQNKAYIDRYFRNV